MDDLNRIALDRLEDSCQELIAHATRLRDSRDIWRLVAFASGVVAVLFALGSLGVFRP